ncbi:hypothetical protein HK101_002976, partial [Irineochytrium annulatum]
MSTPPHRTLPPLLKLPPELLHDLSLALHPHSVRSLELALLPYYRPVPHPLTSSPSLARATLGAHLANLARPFALLLLHHHHHQPDLSEHRRKACMRLRIGRGLGSAYLAAACERAPLTWTDLEV